MISLWLTNCLIVMLFIDCLQILTIAHIMNTTEITSHKPTMIYKVSRAVLEYSSSTIDSYAKQMVMLGIVMLRIQPVTKIVREVTVKALLICLPESQTGISYDIFQYLNEKHQIAKFNPMSLIALNTNSDVISI